MLRTLNAENKQHWSRHISAVIHAYNSTANYATVYSPYKLMLESKVQLLVDLAFSTSIVRTSVTSHRGYVDSLRENLKMANKT